MKHYTWIIFQAVTILFDLVKILNIFSVYYAFTVALPLNRNDAFVVAKCVDMAYTGPRT